MLTLLASLFLFAPTDGATAEPVWRQWVVELRQHVDQSRWYEARRQLSLLEALDTARFTREGYPVTRAWIYAHERCYASAADAYLATPKTQQEPLLVLEYAESLMAIGHYGEAFRSLAQLNDRKLQRRERWRKHLMAGECAQVAGDHLLALRHYDYLVKKRSPASFRLPATLRSAAINYEIGRVTAARAHVSKIIHSWPASDEALSAVELQKAHDISSYTQSSSRLESYAWVYYRNREFDRSDACYAALIADPAASNAHAKAIYFQSLTQLKRENPAAAIPAFEKAVERLNGTRYEGMAQFQFARALFMVGRDYDVVHVSHRAQQDVASEKWRYEIAKLQMLAMRRLGQYPEFESLGNTLLASDAPHWIRRFYHRNGVVWSLHLGETANAGRHLERYRASSPDPKESLELALWHGLIQWQNGQTLGAIDSWLETAKRDPNHYTGLVARTLIDSVKHEAHATVSVEAEDPLIASPLEGFFLADNDTVQDLYAQKLAADVTIPELSQLERKAQSVPAIQAWINIARYDLAAEAINNDDLHLNKIDLHYLKSRWYLAGHRFNESIYHAEILGRSYPRWLPLEILPSEFRRLMYPIGHQQLVRKRAEVAGVDPYLLLAIIREESRFDEQAKSVASARGLMQFIPSTARRVALDLGLGELALNDLYDARTSVALGAAYVDTLMGSLGDVPLYSIAAYNAGEDAVQRWRSMADRYDPVQFVWDITYNETRDYCHKVMGAYHHYRSTYEPLNEADVIRVPNVALLSR